LGSNFWQLWGIAFGSCSNFGGSFWELLWKIILIFGKLFWEMDLKYNNFFKDIVNFTNNIGKQFLILIFGRYFIK
jgi:hypothetical protein